MWTLKNRTPYAAERSWIRDKHGVHHWVVAVKATFAFSDTGALTLADEQLPVVVAPEWFGDPASTSLKYDTDTGPPKPSTDVIVIGSAYAPKGKVATSVPVRLRFGAVDKSLIVFGDRVYETGPVGVVLSSPARFAKKAIRYEEAWGGADLTHPDASKHARDPRNPVGRGFSVHASLHRKTAHSVEYPQGFASKSGPAGFCAIDRPWQPRIAHAGTYDGAWVKHKKPLLPDDYDPRFELCAPPDQRQKEYVYGGELVELTNMIPAGVLRLTLPKIYLTFSTKIRGGVEQHRARLASVILEPDDQRVALVWQSSLQVAARQVEHLDVTTISEKPYAT
ncbi:MAG TPA: DUF2169 domain-containing protein [Polyangiales bacterium]